MQFTKLHRDRDRGRYSYIDILKVSGYHIFLITDEKKLLCFFVCVLFLFLFLFFGIDIDTLAYPLLFTKRIKICGEIFMRFSGWHNEIEPQSLFIKFLLGSN